MEQRFTKPAPSLAMTIIDVFASPSDVFQSIKDSMPSRSLWLIPMLCTYFIFICNISIIFTNDVLKYEFNETQSRILQKKVKEGKLTREEANQIESNVDSRNDLMIVFTVASGIMSITLFYFGSALFLLLVNKFLLESSVVFFKHLELFGITSWIYILGRIVSIAMIVSFGTVTATPSAALAVLGSYDSTNIVFRILTAFNIFSIWEVILIGIGLGKISGKSSSEGIIVTFILWALWIVFSILLGITL